ncbi:unnamed protein product [Staurois parvus]|uniref:Uncharacterized protein n=1 Tax=Staurois parvus TaxID=386267 RepID=A0ABN9CWM1_9NEOB|nr:unnamed protein product [Staurois parvus]
MGRSDPVSLEQLVHQAVMKKDFLGQESFFAVGTTSIPTLGAPVALTDDLAPAGVSETSGVLTTAVGGAFSLPPPLSTLTPPSPAPTGGPGPSAEGEEETTTTLITTTTVTTVLTAPFCVTTIFRSWRVFWRLRNTLVEVSSVVWTVHTACPCTWAMEWRFGWRS